MHQRSTACQSNSSSQRVEQQHRFEQTSRNNQHETNQLLKCADTVDSKHHTEENVKHEKQHATNARKKELFASQTSSDNGTPYNSEQFKQYAKYMGFKHTKKIPYTPWANGTAENFMRNLGNWSKLHKKRRSTGARSSTGFLQHIEQHPTQWPRSHPRHQFSTVENTKPDCLHQPTKRY